VVAVETDGAEGVAKASAVLRCWWLHRRRWILLRSATHGGESKTAAGHGTHVGCSTE
jgi:hypothetical protein